MEDKVTDDKVTFVHLTDLHVGNPEVEDKHLHSDTSATMAEVLTRVATLQPKPAFIIASGDLTNRGDTASYLQLKRLFAEAALDIPVILALGNHDTRPGFYEGMLGRSEDKEAPYFHDQVLAGVHVIVLDTSVPGEVGGGIETEQFAWLEERLDAYPELPKLIVAHHPPALEEIPELEWESISFADTDTLAAMLAGYNVVGILSGHMHYDRVSNWHGIPIVMGVGQHAAMDVLWLHEGLRMVEGASFAIGTVRPSGLSIAFAPLAASRRELMKVRYRDMPSLTKKFYGSTPKVAAE